MNKNILKNKQLLIFDIDGVLFNSEEANRAYFQKCLEKIGLYHIKKDIEDKIPFMSLEQLLYEIISDKDEAKEALQNCRDISYDPFLEYIEPLFNFAEILPLLTAKYFLAAASNRGKSLTTLFKHFNLFKYFPFKISSLEAPSKPNPQMLIKCCDYFDIPKEQSIFIGDSISDYNAALNAEIEFIRVGSSAEGLSIDGVGELIKYI